MIFLQVISATDSLHSSSQTSSVSFYYYLELIIIVGVIIYQLYQSVKAYRNINDLRDIFDERIKVKNGYIERNYLNTPENIFERIAFVDDEEKSSSPYDITDKNIIKITVAETSGVNEIIVRIKNAINTYLLNNYGAAVNFSIIKDIIDREVDAKDEEISQSIPTPLYFGLAATMIGIIFGLLAMPNLNTNDFSTAGIKALIDGVKLAMGSSLTGLLCTTFLSSFFYKEAKKSVLRDKNEQISYLQAKLLPELIKAEDTGVSGLKASLDRFAREASKIVENVNNAATNTGINIKAQQDIISRIEKINVTKVSKFNLELFDKLEQNLEIINHFSAFLSQMDKISSNLSDFALRTTNIDGIVKNIESTIYDSNQLTRFLTAHFQKIESYGNATLRTVDLSDAYFREAIEKLKEETDKRILQLNADANNNESKLIEIYNNIGQKLAQLTSEHISQFQALYSNSIPQFKQLDNLEILPKIQEQVADSATKLLNDSNATSEILIERFESLNSSLKTLQNSLNSQAILSKLYSIDDKLKDGTGRHKGTRDGQVRSENPGSPVKKQLSLLRLFSELFNTKA